MNKWDTYEQNNKRVNVRVYSFLKTFFTIKRNMAISKDLGRVALEDLNEKAFSSRISQKINFLSSHRESSPWPFLHSWEARASNRYSGRSSYLSPLFKYIIVHICKNDFQYINELVKRINDTCFSFSNRHLRERLVLLQRILLQKSCTLPFMEPQSGSMFDTRS